MITGANGQLGMEFRKIAPLFPDHHFVFVTREELPLDDAEKLDSFFKEHHFHFCVNCAAYTAVDKAETETEKAFLVNGTAVGHLAALCRKNDTVLIHISTDYVFDGNATVPYKEDHPTNPAGTYGASKLKGEELALAENKDAIIIRTSWVYSEYGSNFVKTMLRLMKERESINVVNDQVGRPTYAADLAKAIMQIIQSNSLSGIQFPVFNFSNSGEPVSWYEFATAIKELSGSQCTVNPIPTSAYPTPAKRPHYSVLDLSRTEQQFGLHIPAWKESLAACINILAAQ